jgi:hypothetical protein
MESLLPRWIVLRSRLDTRVLSVFGYGNASQGWYGYDAQRLETDARCNQCGQCVFSPDGNWEHWIAGKPCDGKPLLINAPAWALNEWMEEKHG